jgi:hypothetical protein
MTYAVEQPQHITSLATSAVLVSWHNSVWTGTVTDKQTRDEIAATKGAEAEALDFAKKVLKGMPEHKALMNYRQTLTNGMKLFTYPWMGDTDILPMARYAKFMAWWDERVEQHKQLYQAFRAVYPMYVSGAAANHTGTLHNLDDFPKVEELDGKSTMTLQISPVPANDFRVQVSQDLANDLHKHYATQTETIVKSVTDQQVSQLIPVLESLHKSCGYTVTTKADGSQKVSRNKVVETTFHKALDMIDTFKTFNPTQSPELEEIRVLFEQALKGVTIEGLRDSDSVRARVQTDVEGVLNKFKRKAQA